MGEIPTSRDTNIMNSYIFFKPRRLTVAKYSVFLTLRLAEVKQGVLKTYALLVLADVVF